MINWVVDADFRKFFDTIDPRWLQQFVAHRIGDQRLLRLIDKWLTAGVLEDGQVTQPERGTPQGSVISPLLANIYLHFVFDLWALQWRRRTARGDMVMVRYADDTFLGFEHREEAERFLAELRERVAQFGLSLLPEKTRLIAFGRYANAWCRSQGQRRAQTFDFLGFTHICGITRGKGWFQLRRVTMAKRMHAKLAEIKQKLRRRLHGRMREVGAWLHKVLQGFYNYHAVPGNLRRLWSMRYRLLHAWWRILARRSQLRMSWDRYFSRVRTWLPEPRVLHPGLTVVPTATLLAGIYGLPLRCKRVVASGIRIGLHKYIRPLMRPSTRALMTVARRSLIKSPVSDTIRAIRLILRRSDLLPSVSTL